MNARLTIIKILVVFVNVKYDLHPFSWKCFLKFDNLSALRRLPDSQLM